MQTKEILGLLLLVTVFLVGTSITTSMHKSDEMWRALLTQSQTMLPPLIQEEDDATSVTSRLRNADTRQQQLLQQQQQQSSSTRITSTTSVVRGIGCTIPSRAPRPIKIRDDLGYLAEELNFTHGVEIGVKRGHFAMETLTRWKSCQSYALVDLWQQQSNYKDDANVDDNIQEEYFQTTLETLQPWAHITHFYRNYSTAAAAQMLPQSLDYAYIDARHDYCGCLEDIEAYWPLLRPGGIMAGHDYLTAAEVPEQDWSVCGDGSIQPRAVRGAVEDFFTRRGITVSVAYQDGMWPTWIAVKPEC